MPENSYDAFLGYNSAERATAERLALRLRDEGLRVFFDQWELIPGRPWQEELERALYVSRVCLVLVRSSTLGPWQTEEMRVALAQLVDDPDRQVVPVLLPGADEKDLPAFLQRLTRIELGDDEEEGFHRLVAAIKGRPPGPGAASRRPDPEPRPSRSYYLRRLELEWIRGFYDLDLDFGDPPRRQNVVIGRNGTCKTTLLRAIVLALAGEKDAPALLSAPNGRWVTSGARRGVVRLHLESAAGGSQAIRELEIVADRQGELIRSSSPALDRIFLCAYGMGRGHVGGEPGRDYRVMDSVATLFRYEERLASSELTLRRLYDYLGSKNFDAILAGLKRALGLGPEYRIELPQGGGVEISGPGIGGRIPLEGWADGYRMTFSWMIDFYGWAMRAGAFDETGEVCGILLVDELEQHLHPAMQREILGQLAKALPRAQIVTTTHSPLVALSARPEQILALHRDGSRIDRRPVPPLDGYSAEDVLVEETLFGDRSVRSRDPAPPVALSGARAPFSRGAFSGTDTGAQPPGEGARPRLPARGARRSGAEPARRARHPAGQGAVGRMIRVDRNRLSEDGSPIRPPESWTQKAKDATRRALDEGSTHKVSDLYRDDEPRMALEKLFYDKCAYCESKLGATAPWEVELRHATERGCPCPRRLSTARRDRGLPEKDLLSP